MSDLDKRIEQLEIQLFYLNLIRCISKTLCNETKSNNSSYYDFIMKRFTRVE